MVVGCGGIESKSFDIINKKKPIDPIFVKEKAL